MTVVRLKLPKKLAAKLDRVAKSQRRSTQAVMREAIELQLKGEQKTRAVSAYELIKHLAGTLEGPPDLATNPKYMKGFGE